MDHGSLADTTGTMLPSPVTPWPWLDAPAHSLLARHSSAPLHRNASATQMRHVPSPLGLSGTGAQTLLQPSLQQTSPGAPQLQQTLLSATNSNG